MLVFLSLLAAAPPASPARPAVAAAAQESEIVVRLRQRGLSAAGIAAVRDADARSAASARAIDARGRAAVQEVAAIVRSPAVDTAQLAAALRRLDQANQELLALRRSTLLSVLASMSPADRVILVRSVGLPGGQ